MHLHRLRFAAIGPFPGEHEIDFDRLGASGLFLLEGPTGAGKSTIIDAVVFALYGQVAAPGSAGNDRMHSDFAAPGVEPFVQLDFATSSGLYRVRRTPKFDRPKARGTGTTTQNATARLWRLTSPDTEPDAAAATTSVAEVGVEVARAVGLSREQFVKTVVLPQGEFAAFLRAAAEERRELLERLFGTEVFDRVLKRLEEMRRSATAQRTDAEVAVREAVAAFAGAVGLPEEERDQLGEHLKDPEALLNALDGVVGSLADEVGSLAQAREAARAAADLASNRFGEAQQREASRLDKQALLSERDRLAGRSAAVAESNQKLHDAQRAEIVRAVLDGHRTAGQRAETLGSTLDHARAALPGDIAALEPSAWSTAEQDRRAEAQRLSPLAELEVQLAGREGELAQVEVRERSLAKALGEVVAEQEELPGRLAALRAEEESAQASAAAEETAATSVKEARTRVDAATQAAQLGNDLHATDAVVATAVERATAAQADEDLTRRRYIAAMAGHLAADLAPGQPCPVCGSTEHPATAELAVDAVGPADVDVAETERRHRLAALEGATAERSRLAAQLAAADVSSGGLLVDAAQAELASATAALAAAADAGRRQAALRDQRERAEQDQERLAKERAGLAADHGAAVALVGALKTSLSADRARLADARGSDTTVAGRVDRLTAEAGTLADLGRLMANLDAARDDLEQRTEEVDRLAASHGFDDAEAARAALLDDLTIDALRTEVAEHERDVTAVELRLAEPRLAGVDVTAVPDLAPIERAAAESAEYARRAQDEHARADLRHGGAVTGRADVATAFDRQVQVIADTAPVIRIANLVAAHTADNALTMTLPTFVLLERFRDVVAAANQRLAVMSDGRFGLEHLVDKEGGRRAGLGLVVLDSNTDTRRHPTTLSGGETFYCSLALALGLADVVTSEAGGIDLGTLFVDEGFGTLDPDTLDQVVTVLSGLRTGGRTVGIVSHVAELKERISERVTVRRQPDGSSRIEVVA